MKYTKHAHLQPFFPLLEGAHSPSSKWGDKRSEKSLECMRILGCFDDTPTPALLLTAQKVTSTLWSENVDAQEPNLIMFCIGKDHLPPGNEQTEKNVAALYLVTWVVHPGGKSSSHATQFSVQGVEMLAGEKFEDYTTKDL